MSWIIQTSLIVFYYAKYYATAVFFWQSFWKLAAAKAHMDIFSSGPIAINCPRHMAYYLDGLNDSTIIDCVSFCKILCDRSVLLAASHFEK